MAHGLTSRTKAYRVAYASLQPLVRLIGVALFSERTTTTGRLGRAMLNAARAPDRFPQGRARGSRQPRGASLVSDAMTAQPA
jgi:hypothetical protein